MKLYGSSLNLTALYNHGFHILEEAGMDYRRALPQVEIYVGSVFKEEAIKWRREPRSQGGRHPLTLYDTDIDDCRALSGEKGVAAYISQHFFLRLGALLHKIYLASGSRPWHELERVLNLPVNHSGVLYKVGGYHCTTQLEFAARLFEQVVKSRRILDVAVMLHETETLRVIKISPHRIRAWFYQLWNQPYEWGSFKISQKLAEANGWAYYFDVPPRLEKNRGLLQGTVLLEAHGFKVSLDSGDVVEYWR